MPSIRQFLAPTPRPYSIRCNYRKKFANCTAENRKGMERFMVAILLPHTSEYSSHSSVVWHTVPYFLHCSIFFKGFWGLRLQIGPVSLCLHVSQWDKRNCNVRYRRNTKQERTLCSSHFTQRRSHFVAIAKAT